MCKLQLQVGSILTAEMLGSILTAEMLAKAISRGNIITAEMLVKTISRGTHSNYTPGLEVRMPLWWKDVDFKKRPAYRVKNPGGILTLFI